MARTSAVTAMLLFGALYAAAAAAELQVSLEPRVIDELSTTRLTIRATDTNQTAPLDLSALEVDFDVLGTQSASQYRAINGQVEAWVEYQISLRPRRAGNLTVPAVSVGSETTRPLELTVRAVDPQVRDAIDRMVFFETELSANPVYVQAETVLTRRLYYSSGAQIYSDLPGVPDIENAVVTPLGETKSSTTSIDGQRYGVVEQRFAILPEQSGTLTIPSISVTSSVRLESNGRLRRSGVRVSTDELALEVLPIPPEYPSDRPWLPAEQVSLTDRWDPDTGSISLGEPITREITVQVTGNVASAIPSVQSELRNDNLRQYPEPPDLSDDTSGATVVGRREQRYSLVPTQPGAARVPEISVTWWDVTDKTVRSASAPARLLRITGTPHSTGASVPGSSSAEAASPGTAFPPDGSDTPPRNGQIADPGNGNLSPWPAGAGWLAAGLATLIAVVGCLGWIRTARRLRRFAEPTGSATPAARGPGGIDRRRKALQDACRSNDTAAMHHALLAYLASFYETSTANAAARFRDAGHGALLDRLNARLYGRTQDPEAEAVDGSEVLSAAQSLTTRNRPTHKDPLPPLYS